MDNYFLSVVEKLELNELELLNTLTRSESTNRFSAVTKKCLFEKMNQTEAKFRKVLYRLEAMNLIEVVAGNKEHSIFVTEYGQNAIHLIHERSNA